MAALGYPPVPAMSQRLPVVAIVGRPNVGKSTLFNRIVGSRLAVVEDTPGVTRDRLYAQAEHFGKVFTLVDTGGILFMDDDPLVEQIRVQAQVALAEADAIIMMVDCVEGVSAGDIDLANQLRGFRKPIIVAANKADNKRREQLASEFFELGLGDVMPVSGLNGMGVSDMLDAVCDLLPTQESLEEVPEELRLAIVGRPNVGKSSLLNAFTGEKRAIVSSIPGTTRDAIDTLVEYRGQPVRLIDTAGLRRRGKVQGTIEYYMALRATNAIERCDCVLVVVDGQEGLTDGDKRTAKMAHDEGRALVIAVNKWDLMEDMGASPRRQSPERKEFVKTIRNELPEMSYAPICFTSANASWGLDVVMDQVFQATENWKFRITTGPLNRLIQDAAYERPYTSKGKALKLYYASQVSNRPPTIVVFCNDLALMHFSYRRYLENRIRKEYPLPGTPIRLIVKPKRAEE